MLRPNLVETTKCPGSFCTWTLEFWAPPLCETAPSSKLRWPEAPPVIAAPSGALIKVTEIVPSTADFIEMAEEVRLAVPLLCAHPPVMREEPNSNNGSTNRRPIFAPPRKLYSIYYPRVLYRAMQPVSWRWLCS